ncbi:type II secretion system secretin GspD [Thiosulfativibrio zosterae]|uniref:Type II secretion system protein GspD n=1 Tax=Thiosulfativibrio zosterae TaxID=2675053 RepID=A0A6F8PKQ8_9GAMM|nr:type II secretion system secretin GspD [Thiosulfativibrio zosterae]BBP42666.1 type II secretion system protein GspD [Thiosulfativibrio zosterae]
MKFFNTRWLAASCLILSFAMPQALVAAPVNSPLAQNKVQLTQSFQQAELETVIEAVAKLTGKNFIIDPRVKGKVTLYAPEPMAPEDLYETLLSILRVHGFVAIPGKTAIQIIPANTARDQVPYDFKGAEESDWITEVLTVNNVDASKLVAVLRPLVARDGHLVALSDSNKLIITDSLINVERVKTILKRVDVDESAGYEVIKLEYASAEDLVQTIKKIAPKSASNAVNISFDERSNKIIMAGDLTKRREIRILIAELDVKVPSEGNVQVIYLHYAKAKDLVPVLQKISTNRSLLNSAAANDGGATEVPATAEATAETKPSGVKVTQLDDKTLKSRISIEAEERMNAIVISAPPSVVTALKTVIKQLDIRRAQVLIEAILVEVSESKQAELGVEWGAAGPNGVGLINFSGTLPTIVGSIAAGTPATGVTALGRGASTVVGEVSADNTGWGALIRALNSDTGSNILATPSLLTLDNEEAEIVVGKEVPFQTGSYTGTGTSTTPTNPFNTIERKNVGLSLKVTPQINEGNEVFLEIDQEVSDVLPKGDAVDIQTSKRQIKTSIIVGDGNMIVLGGLLSEKETEVESKVPGLGDLPLIGGLFRSTSNQREKVNLMIFLRPVIVRNNEMSDYYSSKKYSYIRDEQSRVLEQDSGLLNGLRPRMPSEQQWKNSEPAKPYVSELEAKKQADLDAEKAKQAAVKAAPEKTFAEELLGL